MRNTIIAFAALLLSACTTGDSPESQNNPNAIQVMVLGAYHMAPSGSDVINFEVESVLSETRQDELASMANALAAFEPTRIALERTTAAPDFEDLVYPTFKPTDLKEKANERYQIGYRLAHQLSHDKVYGIDEQNEGDEPDYFPFDKLMAHTKATGQDDDLTAQIQEAQAMVGRFSEIQKTMTVSELLVNTNSGEMSDPAFYYKTTFYDRGDAQPGAELQAYWFMRNAKIFSKLNQVAEPGDRIIVVYGAGHKFWLEHMVKQTPGYVLVDPVSYLKAAKQ